VTAAVLVVGLLVVVTTRSALEVPSSFMRRKGRFVRAQVRSASV
jgi:hypothetical protein